MSRVLAVDLGKTSCRVRLRVDGTVMEASGPGSPGLATVDGLARAEAAILAVAGPLLRRAGLDGVEVAGVGAAGALTAPEAAGALAAALCHSLPATRAMVCSDATAAHAGALGGAPGVVLAIGTGAVAIGIGADGAMHRGDGWGGWLGDEGGGAWLGRQGLAAALRHADGRGPATALHDRAVERFGPLPALVAEIEGAAAPARLLAEFAPDVAEAAAAGDPVAAGLMDAASAALAGTADGVARRAGVDTIAVTGGLAHLPGLMERLGAVLTLVPAMGEPLDGVERLATPGGLPGGGLGGGGRHEVGVGEGGLRGRGLSGGGLDDGGLDEGGLDEGGPRGSGLHEGSLSGGDPRADGPRASGALESGLREGGPLGGGRPGNGHHEAGLHQPGPHQPGRQSGARPAPGLHDAALHWAVRGAGPEPALSQLDRLATEGVRPGLDDLDLRPPAAIVALVLAAEREAHGALSRAEPALAAAAEGIAARMRAGGRLFTLGAGTPGRLATLDAAELAPTYSAPPGLVIPLLAGGPAAMIDAVEGAEDDAAAAGLALDRHALSAGDAVVGIAASGRTPYVVGGLSHARALGALTVAIVNNPASPAAAAAEIAVEILTGPEIVAGSTRMTAGTVQKIALNALSTAAMIALGKTYGARMVDVRATNAKLRRRAIRIVREITGAGEDAALAALEAAQYRVKPALVALVAGVDMATAERMLDAAGGRVRDAVARGGG